MWILGISAFYHDSAAALVRDGEIMAAAQEERFSRRKHDARFPVHAVRYCLESAGVGPGDIDAVVFYEKPFLKFERLLENYLAFAPRGLRSFQMALPLWIREKLFQKDVLSREMKELYPGADWADRLLFTEHHQSHAASAFFPSPFEEALVLTMDGVGEWTTTSAALGTGNQLKIIREIRYPHSLGLLYSAFTYYTGFKVNSGEYKLMGLAPYGKPKYAGLIMEKLIDLKSPDQPTFDALGLAEPGDVLAAEQDLSRARHQHAGYQVDEGGFTGPVGADQGVARPLLQAEIDVVRHADRAKALEQPTGFQHRRAHVRRLR